MQLQSPNPHPELQPYITRHVIHIKKREVKLKIFKIRKKKIKNRAIPGELSAAKHNLNNFIFFFSLSISISLSLSHPLFLFHSTTNRGDGRLYLRWPSSASGRAGDWSRGWRRFRVLRGAATWPSTSRGGFLLRL